MLVHSYSLCSNPISIIQYSTDCGIFKTFGIHASSRGGPKIPLKKLFKLCKPKAARARTIERKRYRESKEFKCYWSHEKLATFNWHVCRKSREFKRKYDGKSIENLWFWIKWCEWRNYEWKEVSNKKIKKKIHIQIKLNRSEVIYSLHDAYEIDKVKRKWLVCNHLTHFHRKYHPIPINVCGF